MKFIVLLRKYFISFLLFILFSEETLSAKLDTKNSSKQIIVKTNRLENNTEPKGLKSFKNIELITLPKNQKFYISSKDIKVN